MNIVEQCPTCFTVEGSWFGVHKEIIKAKKEGHILFQKNKIGKGVYQAVLSTNKYGVKK
jgi:hypothetical protein